jgi:hypothetical protein
MHHFRMYCQNHHYYMARCHFRRFPDNPDRTAHRAALRNPVPAVRIRFGIPYFSSSGRRRYRTYPRAESWRRSSRRTAAFPRSDPAPALCSGHFRIPDRMQNRPVSLFHKTDISYSHHSFFTGMSVSLRSDILPAYSLHCIYYMCFYTHFTSNDTGILLQSSI